MKPITPLEIRILANLTDDQLDRARDNLLDLRRPWTAAEARFALALLHEYDRRADGVSLFRA